MNIYAQLSLIMYYVDESAIDMHRSWTHNSNAACGPFHLARHFNEVNTSRVPRRIMGGRS